MSPENILKYVVNRKKHSNYYWFLCDLQLPCIPPCVFASNLRIVNAVYLYLPSGRAWAKDMNNLAPVWRPEPKRVVFPEWQRGEEIKVGRLTDLKWKLTYNAIIEYSVELSLIESYNEYLSEAFDDTAWV